MPEDTPVSSTAKQSPNAQPDRNNHQDTASLADALKQESDRLLKLAEQLREREKYLAEMEAEYPYLKKAVLGWLIEKSLAEVPPLPDDVDLEKMVKEEGWQQLSEFIDDL